MLKRVRFIFAAAVAVFGSCAFAQDAFAQDFDRPRQSQGRGQGGLVHLHAAAAGAEDRQHVREGTRHQGRDVPLRRLRHPAPLPAGDRRRTDRSRRVDHVRSGGGSDADAQRHFRRFQAEELRQGPGRRQGQGRQLRRPAAEPDDELYSFRQSAGCRRAEDLGRPRRSKIQGQDGDRRSLVHLAAGVGGRHDVEGARLGLLREAAGQRHHGRAGQSAGCRYAEARRAADRGRRAGFLRGRGPRRRPSDEDALSERRRVRHSVADLGGQRRAESERRQAVRRVQHQRRGAEDVSGRGRLRGAERYRRAGRLARRCRA